MVQVLYIYNGSGHCTSGPSEVVIFCSSDSYTLSHPRISVYFTKIYVLIRISSYNNVCHEFHEQNNHSIDNEQHNQIHQT